MGQIFATRSVSITELKRRPSTVLEQAGSEPVAVLKHNRLAAYLLAPHLYEAMLTCLNDGLRSAVHEGTASGPGIPADAVFAELKGRYAEPKAFRQSSARRRA